MYYKYLSIVLLCTVSISGFTIRLTKWVLFTLLWVYSFAWWGEWIISEKHEEPRNTRRFLWNPEWAKQTWVCLYPFWMLLQHCFISDELTISTWLNQWQAHNNLHTHTNLSLFITNRTEFLSYHITFWLPLDFHWWTIEMFVTCQMLQMFLLSQWSTNPSPFQVPSHQSECLTLNGLKPVTEVKPSDLDLWRGSAHLSC